MWSHTLDQARICLTCRVGITTGEEMRLGTGDKAYLETGEEACLRTGEEACLRTGEEVCLRTGEETCLRTGEDCSEKGSETLWPGYQKCYKCLLPLRLKHFGTDW